MAFKSIAGLLEELSDEPVEGTVLTAEEKRIADIKSADTEVRAAKVFDMKLSGVSVQAIAQGFDVHPSTIYNWLQQHAESYRSQLENQPAANIIAESLQFLDKIIELCLFEVNQLTSDGVGIGETGVVTRPENRHLLAKNRFLNSAIKAFGMRLDLMQTTGVLPKEADRIYHSMIEEKRDGETESVGKERSLDDMKENILKLMSRGRVLT